MRYACAGCVADVSGVACACGRAAGRRRGNEDQGGDGGAEQAADDGAAERGVLLAAFAGAERHGDHADDHGERGHHDGAEAGGAGFDGGLDGVAVLLETLLGEGDDEDAVGGGDAHAHDGAHQRGHAESVVWVRKRKSTMPASAAGSAVMMMKGSSQDWKLTTMSR